MCTSAVQNMDARNRPRPLEINDIDHLIRLYGGSTVALEMEPQEMKKGKERQGLPEHVEYLSRRNGELRAEIAFYRECYQCAEKMKHEVTSLSQDLLDQCIIGLFDGASFTEIRNLVQALCQSAESYRKSRQKALSRFIAPYKQHGFKIYIESEALV